MCELLVCLVPEYMPKYMCALLATSMCLTSVHICGFVCRYEFCIAADAQTSVIPNFVRSALQFRGSDAVALCIGYEVAATGKTATFTVSLMQHCIAIRDAIVHVQCMSVIIVGQCSQFHARACTA
jgi:hypothetical protein